MRSSNKQSQKLPANPMRYPAKHYARAFAELACGEGIESVHEKMTKAKKDALIRNLIEAARRHGDLRKLSTIAKEAARIIRKKNGTKSVRIETARPFAGNPKKMFHNILHPHDALETKITPELLAGIKITVDEDREFDMTLLRKLDALFASSNF